MEMLQIIILASIVMWYIIDRIKPLWADKKYGKYVTMAVAAVFGVVLAFGYDLDIMAGLGVTGRSPILGKTITALTMMGGSSAVAELIGKIQKK